MGKAKSDKVVWLDKGWQPHHIGFCPSKRAWDREMKRLKSKSRYLLDETDKDGYCVTFDQTKDIAQCSIISINPKLFKRYKREPRYVLGVLVHECVHAYQEVLSTMGETKPGEEFEAYAVQHIFCRVFDEFIKHVRK